MAKALGPRPRNRDINRAVGGLVFARHVTGVDFQFQPSIGLIAKNVDKLGTDIRSFREPLTRAIKEVMIPSFHQNFISQGRPEAWEELAPYTVEKRRASGPILIRSGRLMKAAQQFSIWDVSQNGAVITALPSKAWYGVIHQGGLDLGFAKFIEAAKKELGEKARPSQITRAAFEDYDEAGAGRKAGTSIPARPFIMFQEEDVDAIQEIFFDWLDQRIELYWARMGG